MTVNRTTLLDLPLPVTGTESGTWGDTTNNGLTQYMDIAIAGMSNLTSANFTAGALTIETTEGDSSATNISATSAQYAGFRVSSLAVNSTITVGNTGTSPARSYRLINADATYSLTFKATGQTGVTLLPGQSAVVAFNGTDYVIVGVVGAGTATDNAVARFDGTTGEILQNSVVTIADSTGDVAGVGALTMGGNLTLSGGTANGVLYLNGSKVATSGSALTFDGSQTLSVGTTGGNITAAGTSGTTVLVASTTSNNLQVQSRPDISYSRLISSAYLLDIATAANQPISFTVNITEQMRLTSTGLGIGTSSPSTKLQVNGNVYLGGAARNIYADNGSGIFFNGLNNFGSGIYSDGSGTALKFQTSSTDRMTLDSSGNLGLGVTPSALLWPNGSAGGLQLQAGALLSAYNATTYLSNNWYYNAGEKYIGNGYATRYEQTQGKHAWYYAGNNTSGAGATVSWTQAMTLDASGNLLVGHTAVYSPVSNYKSVQINGVTGGIVDMGDGSGVYGRTSADVNGLNLEALGSRYTAFRTNNTERARITSGGEVYIAGTTDQGAYNLQVNGTGVWGAGAYVNGSDERLKDNIQTLNDGLAVVSQLRPVTFQYKPEHSKDQSVQPGFIAQELQQAMDGKAYLDGVVQSGPEYLNVAYQNLIPILTKAIQEQQALITSLTARVALLEGN